MEIDKMRNNIIKIGDRIEYKFCSPNSGDIDENFDDDGKLLYECLYNNFPANTLDDMLEEFKKNSSEYGHIFTDR